MTNVRAGSSLSEIEEEIKNLRDKVFVAKTNLNVLEDELENKQKEYEENKWMKTEHPKEFGDLYISSNFGSWENIKEEHYDSPFYVHVPENGGSLPIKDAKDLVKYLQQKIDYLEEK